MFDNKNKNGGLIDDIYLARSSSGSVNVQTGFNTNDDMDSSLLGARLKLDKYLKFSMVTGNLKEEATRMKTFDECLNICSKYIT